MRLDKPGIITCFTARGALAWERLFFTRLPQEAAKFAEQTWPINFHSRSRP